MRSGAALAAAVVLSLLAAGTAQAKFEHIEARVDAMPPDKAAVGALITVRWTITGEAAGERFPFSATGVFIRLVGAPGAARTEALARELAPGRYVARVRVPKGGLRKVRIGLRGTACEADGDCRRSDVFFPVRIDRD